jgi:AraC family transcriptional regulator of adaptative response/methylated-DNA-[protein]-cysteine methyltransferase
MQPNLTCSFSTDEERWKAVIHRDAIADGKFFYSVKTTKVYCKPSCASRQPRRENIAFHNSSQTAERAGFRPCKRCQPNGKTLAEDYAAKVAAACHEIEIAETFPKLDSLAKSAGLSRFHFHRVFKKTTGLTPKAYAAAHRANRIRAELSNRKTVTEAIYSAGFNSNGGFYAKSSRMLGMSPKKFRDGGAGATIRFAISNCSLGAILVAASEKGVCAILLDDDPNTLLPELRRRFPKAQLVEGDKKFERTVTQVIRFVDAPKLGLNLPLDLRGTAFQQRVWNALLEIPPGSTTSYSEIAKRIGSPESVRAVAGAIAANHIAVAVPCHRVLHRDGGISGYRWGVKRKRALLAKEKS